MAQQLSFLGQKLQIIPPALVIRSKYDYEQPKTYPLHIQAVLSVSIDCPRRSGSRSSLASGKDKLADKSWCVAVAINNPKRGTLSVRSLNDFRNTTYSLRKAVTVVRCDL